MNWNHLESVADFQKWCGDYKRTRKSVLRSLLFGDIQKKKKVSFNSSRKRPVNMLEGFGVWGRERKYSPSDSGFGEAGKMPVCF
jgi:hypothetical protein